jgi:hypothetical protein
MRLFCLGEGKTMKLNKLIAIPAVALTAGLGLAACGTTVVQPAPVKPAATTPATTPAAAASAPQVIINNNNPAPAPAPTVYVPVQAPVGPAAQSDAWSTAVAYTNDVNAGDNASAWNMLSSSVQSHGWGGSYNTYVADFTPLSFDNVTYSSSSGDSVTFTFTLHNHSTGSESFTTCTFTVDNGVITSST